MPETSTKEHPRCDLCGDPAPHRVKSDVGMVCRDCKGNLVRAENTLQEAGIPPQQTGNQKSDIGDQKS